MPDIVARRILEFGTGINGKRVRFILDVGGAEQTVEVPLLDLVTLVPDLIALSRAPNGFGKVVVQLADHGTSLHADGSGILLALATPEGWGISFEMGAKQLDELRSSLATAATGLQTMQSRN